MEFCHKHIQVKIKLTMKTLLLLVILVFKWKTAAAKLCRCVCYRIGIPPAYFGSIILQHYSVHSFPVYLCCITAYHYHSLFSKCFFGFIKRTSKWIGRQATLAWGKTPAVSIYIFSIIDWHLPFSPLHAWVWSNTQLLLLHFFKWLSYRKSNKG